jgi:hypothetical protein
LTDPLLEQFLSERDVVCPGCSYNLRDLKSDRCPECGDELTLTLRLVEPRQASLITGLVGLSAGCGFGGLLLLYAAISVALRGDQVPPQVYWVNGIGLIIHVAAVVLWVRHWHRIRRLRATTRGLLVLICLAMPLVFVVVFAAEIR